MAKAFEVNGDNVWIADSNKEQLDNCPKKWKKSHTGVRDERVVKKFFDNIKMTGKQLTFFVQTPV